MPADTTDVSPILALPYIQPGQAQKHVTHNEALRRLDVLVQLAVESFGAETPPAAPAEGEVQALGGAPTGAWAGQAGMLAVWADGVWTFLAPQAGWRAFGRAEAELRLWDGAAWVLPPARTDDLDGLGIGTAADATNRLAVKSAATLLSHDGAGHQVKINKATAGDTASVLFQSGWTGHAEIGLAGGTDLSVKVSGDGSAWTEALRIDGAGRMGVGTISPQAAIHAERATGAAAELLRISNDSGAILGIEDRSVAPGSNTGRVWNLQNVGGEFRITTEPGGPDEKELTLDADGNLAINGTLTVGGADYAEWFEWADGNPGAGDRRGMSVVLAGGRIRPARPGEAPIGVVSGQPSMIGDGDMDRWKGKYLRDDFGACLWEDREVVEWTGIVAGDDGPRAVRHSFAADAVPEGVAVPRHATRTMQRRRVLNPAWDPDRPYTPRAVRAEWTLVGLMGKLRLRKGQPVGPRWVRMREVSATVEEWLVR